MNKRTKSRHGGFTLIEVLIVIGIIAVLAATVLVAINPSRQFAQANNTQRASNINAILNAVGQYTLDNKGTLPSNVDAGAEEITDALCDNLIPKYLSALPTDPKSTKKGAPIKDCNDVAPGAVGYEVLADTNNRVVVSAPDAEKIDNVTPIIEVTR
ncbi:type II secretion system protein [Candidatus Kaiserbacteria bacterium]|nr:MAG: type II secretion system protein [Candidatus Kaiserbacteria bacterium]